MTTTPLNRVLSLFLIIALLFTQGCASSKDGRVTQAQATGAGAIIGGLLGVGLAVATGNSSWVAKGAAIGGGAGALAGYAYGTHVAALKQKYANQEDQLDACIAEANSSNQRLYAYNTALSNEVKVLEKQTAALAKSNSKSVARKQHIEKLNGKIAESNSNYEKVNNSVGEFERYVTETKIKDPNRAAALQNELNQLRAHRDQIKTSNTQLASFSARMSS